MTEFLKTDAVPMYLSVLLTPASEASAAGAAHDTSTHRGATVQR